MSGVLRLGNTGAGTGRSTLVAAASNDQTFSLPSAGGTLLTSNTSIPGGTITLDGATINITNGDLNVDSGTLFVDESNNRVGIGTTSPQSVFSVQDGANPIIGLYTGSTFRASLEATVSQTTIRSTSNSPLSFQVGGTGTTEAISIAANTNVTLQGNLTVNGTGGVTTTDGPLVIETNTTNSAANLASFTSDVSGAQTLQAQILGDGSSNFRGDQRGSEDSVASNEFYWNQTTNEGYFLGHNGVLACARKGDTGLLINYIDDNPVTTVMSRWVVDGVTDIVVFENSGKVYMRGPLLINTNNENGGSVAAKTVVGSAVTNSTGQQLVNANGTLELESVGTSIVGTLYVISVLDGNAAVRTHSTYYVANRFGNSTQITLLNSTNGTTAGRTFTITMPFANNIIVFTDTSGSQVNVSMSFVGTTGT